MGAIANRIVAINDDTPDKETKVFVEHDMSCRNKTCPNFEKVVDTVRNEMKLG